MTRLRAGLVVVAVLVTAAMSVPVSAASAVGIVRLTDEFRFDPGEFTVPVNSTVRWQNAGSTAWHTVTAYEDRLPESVPYFDSSGSANETAARQAPADGYLRPGDVFEVTFRILGDYHYFCVPHEGAEMKGVIHVVESLPEPPAADFTVLLVGLAVGAAVVAPASLLVLRRRRRRQ